MLDREITDAELEAAVEALSQPERLAGAQEAVLRVAPQLQRVLDEALHSGGWFDQAHGTEVGKAASDPDPAERERAIRTLLVEETRLSMLVGVAVGLELARELARHPITQED